MKLSIDKKNMLMYFLLIPYLKPYNVTLIPWLDDIFKIWKIIATLIVLFLFFYKGKRIKLHNVYLFGFLATWAVSIFFNHAPKELLNNILSIAGITLLFETFCKDRDFSQRVTTVIKNIAVCSIFLNFITVVQGYPFAAKNMELGDNANFLGGDNYSAFILIVYCGFLLLYDIQRFGKFRLRTYVYSGIALLCLLITFALTGFLALFVLFFAVAVRNIKPFSSVFRTRNVLVVCFVFVIAVAYLHLDELLVTLLGGIGKTGFNGRNFIWPMAVDAILKKPLLGYGAVSPELAKTWLIAGANHTHNILLEYPFSTGIIGSAFLLAYLPSLQDFQMLWKNRESRILLCALSAYLFCSILDFYIGLIHFYLLLEMLNLYRRNIAQ